MMKALRPCGTVTTYPVAVSVIRGRVPSTNATRTSMGDLLFVANANRCHRPRFGRQRRGSRGISSCVQCDAAALHGPDVYRLGPPRRPTSDGLTAAGVAG